MSFLGVHIITDKQFDLLKAGVTGIRSITASPVQQAVAALANTAIGQAVVADIQAVENDDLTGAEKFAKVVESTTPLIVGFLKEGPHAPEAQLDDVVDIARELVQALFNAFKSRGASAIADAIVRTVGHII